jgi:hypothetical protein
MHVPLLHTMFVPQDVPFAMFRVVSVHPIGLQDCVPAWHGFVGVQAIPALHEVHTPAAHTRLVPHEVPLATLPVSVQTGAPLVHTMAAVRHGLVLIVHAIPATQSTHIAALLQTLFVPQLVPAVRFVPLSVQTGVPVAQASAPTWHAFVVGVQAAPS